MNPYDFVRMDWDRKIERRRPTPHDRYEPNTLAGSLTGVITAITPIFLPDPRFKERFLRMSATNKPILPASTLKGLFRSLVETAGPGCWSLFDGTYEKRTADEVNYGNLLPSEYRRCPNIEHLCAACRLFGAIGTGSRAGALIGKVALDDAECRNERPHAAVYTPVLATPKPHHSAWYLQNGMVTGRKFYFHQDGAHYFSQAAAPGSRQPLDHQITPLDTGTSFQFRASFSNVLPKDEWPLLLFSLALEPGMRHKLGNAKPAGFGSVHIELTRIELMGDPRDRYRGSSRHNQSLTGTELRDYMDSQVTACVSRIAPITLQDLRRIWGWPVPAGSKYAYRDREWFAENQSTPIQNS